MKAQVALETLITMTAIAAAVFGIMGTYYKVWNAVSTNLEIKRLNYAVALAKDAAQNCSGSGYTVHLPFSIHYRCEGSTVIFSLGEKEEKINKIRCGRGAREGETKDFSVLNCEFVPIT